MKKISIPASIYSYIPRDRYLNSLIVRLCPQRGTWVVHCCTPYLHWSSSSVFATMRHKQFQADGWKRWKGEPEPNSLHSIALCKIVLWNRREKKDLTRELYTCKEYKTEDKPSDNWQQGEKPWRKYNCGPTTKDNHWTKRLKYDALCNWDRLHARELHI